MHGLARGCALLGVEELLWDDTSPALRPVVASNMKRPRVLYEHTSVCEPAAAFLFPSRSYHARLYMPSLEQPVRNGDLNTVMRLVVGMGDYPGRHRDVLTAGFEIALKQGHLHVAAFLIKPITGKTLGDKLDAPYALLEACLLGDEDEALDLLLEGVPCTGEIVGFGPLMAAAASRSIRLIRALLAQPDVDVNERDGGWRTALHWACFYGAADVVKTLAYDANADVEAADDNDVVAADVALDRGHHDCVWLLQPEQYLVAKWRVLFDASFSLAARTALGNSTSKLLESAPLCLRNRVASSLPLPTVQACQPINSCEGWKDKFGGVMLYVVEHMRNEHFQELLDMLQTRREPPADVKVPVSSCPVRWRLTNFSVDDEETLDELVEGVSGQAEG